MVDNNKSNDASIKNSDGSKQTISVNCPICNKKGKISVPISIVLKSFRLISVTIAPNIICEHIFQVFLDTNLKIRGYSKSDYEIGFDELEQEIRKRTISELLKDAPKEEISKESWPREFWPKISKNSGKKPEKPLQ